MLGVNLLIIIFVLALSYFITIFGLPFLLLKLTNLEWLSIYSTPKASTLSTFFTLSGLNVIWLVGTSLTIIYILLAILNDNPAFLIACFTKQKLTSINLGIEFQFNWYQTFFHKWYWYAVDKNLSKLGVLSKNRKTVLDYNSFSYNSVEDQEFVDVFKSFDEPLWLINFIPYASPLIYQRTSRGAYNYLIGLYPTQPRLLSHYEIGMITFLYCLLNGIVLNDHILKQIWYFHITKNLNLNKTDFALFSLWDNNQLRIVTDIQFNQIVDSVRYYLTPAQLNEYNLILTSTNNCSTKLEALSKIDCEFFKIN